MGSETKNDAGDAEQEVADGESDEKTDEHRDDERYSRGYPDGVLCGDTAEFVGVPFEVVGDPKASR